MKNPFMPNKDKIDKWQFLLFIDDKTDIIAAMGWRRFNFGIVKFTDKETPDMPWPIRVEKGFWWRFMFWLPVDK